MHKNRPKSSKIDEIVKNRQKLKKSTKIVETKPLGRGPWAGPLGPGPLGRSPWAGVSGPVSGPGLPGRGPWAGAPGPRAMGDGMAP